jgi:hypothetical protein
MAQKFLRKKLFHDPTPNAVVLNRIVRGLHEVALKSSLTDAESQEFFRILLLVAHKLVSAWKHKERYKAEEQRLIEALKTPKPTDPDIENSQELLDACDVFLVQVKSALDHMVKILQPVIGINLHTFGEKGEQVFTALENNGPRKHRESVQDFKKNRFERHRAWLEVTISARDRLNHCIDGGTQFDAFSVFKDGDKIVVPSVTDGARLSSALDEMWLSLILLVEDLGGLFLKFRLDPPLVLLYRNVPTAVPKSPWEVTTESAIDEEFGLENFKKYGDAVRKAPKS